VVLLYFTFLKVRVRSLSLGGDKNHDKPWIPQGYAMYYSKSILEKTGSNKEPALRLDRATAGVKDSVIEYLNNCAE